VRTLQLLCWVGSGVGHDDPKLKTAIREELAVH
jgi:hypothetical protein